MWEYREGNKSESGSERGRSASFERRKQIMLIEKELTYVAALLLCMCFVTLLFHETYHKGFIAWGPVASFCLNAEYIKCDFVPMNGP